MSVLDVFLPARGVAQFAAAGAGFAPELPPAAAVPGSTADRGSSAWFDLRTEEITASVSMSIPAVRRAVHVIAGTISTFGLSLWNQGIRVDPSGAAQQWLIQPDVAPRGQQGTTLTRTLNQTLTDAIWHDRCVWEIPSGSVQVGTGFPTRMRRVDPGRVSTLPDPVDPDRVAEVIVTGQGDPLPQNRVVLFEWSGTGGLRRYGWELLDLYMALQAAALNYAKAPHPKAILKNHGADLTDAEIDALLARWEDARTTRSVGYLNDVVDYDTFGWSSADLQLTEAREHAALEVARLFGLPAWSLDAKSGDTMTYSNVTDRRLDLLESLRPWMAPVEQTLSMNATTRSADGRDVAAGLYVPSGYQVRFDADAYTRDAPATRMQTWQTGIASGVLTVDEARHWEPLASIAQQNGGPA